MPRTPRASRSRMMMRSSVMVTSSDEVTSAVDVQDGAGDVARPLQEESNGASHLVEARPSAGRDVLQRARAAAVGGRQDRAQGQAIDPDRRRQGDAQAARHGGPPGLGG